MKEISQSLTDLIKKLNKVKADEIYLIIAQIYQSAQKEANELKKNNDYEGAAKVYLLIAKALTERIKSIKEKEAKHILNDVVSSWQLQAKQTLHEAVNYFTSKAYDVKKIGYADSTTYINKAKSLEYQLTTGSLKDQDKEVSSYYASISEAPTKAIPKPSSTEVKGIPGKPRVNPEKIIIDNDYKPSDIGKDWYDWSVFVVADDNTMNQIESVTYKLHRTFPQPVRRVTDSSDNFRLRTSGWGEFQIKAEIHLKNGETISKYHWLDLGGIER